MKSRLRLLFHVHNLLAGGIEKVLLELLQALPEEQYEVGLLITHYLGEHEVLKPQIPSHIRVHYLLEAPWLNWAKKKKMTGKINGIQKAAAELVLPGFQKQLIRKRLPQFTEGTDIFIDFDMTLGAYHPYIRAKRKVAYCHFSLSRYYDGNKRKLDKLARRLEKNDKVIMLCDEMKDEAARMYPALAPKLERLYNALDITQIKERAKEPLTGYELLEKQPFLLSVGRLQETQKDFGTLIKAYARALKLDPALPILVIVGKGGYQSALEQLCVDEGISQKVIFTGFQTNPYKWMSRCHLFLFSSKYEGLPTVLLEALSLECPIIATQCPTGVREILMDGRAGILVPVGDVGAMSKVIPELLHDEARKIAFREQARKILVQFDIRFMIKSFERNVLDLSVDNGASRQA